jgi:WD domain, G-beta repeat
MPITRQGRRREWQRSFSCRAGERAFEHPELKHGVFFHHVLLGLQKEAKDRKGRVTFAGLAAYVNEEVPDWVAKHVGGGARQSPNLKADYSAEPVLVDAGGGLEVGGSVQAKSDYDLSGGYRFVHFGADGVRVVLYGLVGADDCARVYDLSTNRPITPLLKHEKIGGHAVFSRDGTLVVTASLDNTARVWDAKTGEPVTPPLKHEGYVFHAAFNPDGTRVVTASQATASLWDAQSGKELATVKFRKD